MGCSVMTESSETSPSILNLPCAVDLLLLIRLALWLAPEAGTQPIHVVDIWKYFCSPQASCQLGLLSGEGSRNLHMDFETVTGEDIHPIIPAGQSLFQYLSREKTALFWVLLET